MFQLFSRRAFWHFAAVLFIGASFHDAPVACAQDGNTASVADLQQRVQDLEAVVRQLKEGRDPTQAPSQPFALASLDAAAPADLAAAASVGAVPDRPDPHGSGTTASGPYFLGWNEGFFLQSPDRTCSLRITGQLQADFRGFLDRVDSSSTANTAVAGSPTTGSPDTFLIRRARLGIEATMANYYEFRLLPDFAGTSVAKTFADAYMNVHYWDEFQFEAGKFKQPFSYEELIQDRYVPTMERSMMDQLVPQRDEGVMIHGEKLFAGRFDYAVAVSNGDSNDSTIDNNDHKDFNGRLVLRPFFESDECGFLRRLSVGLSGGIGTENEPLSSTSSTAPTITTPSTVTWFGFLTGVSANGVRDRISPELTYFYHSLGFASQYYQEDQQFQTSAAHAPLVDVSFQGYYFMASYLVTGEQRTEYSQQIAPIRPFDPSCPLASAGAWEFLVRVDRMEVGRSAFTSGLASSSAATTTARSSPECLEVTTGVNWYLTKWSRAQFNWEHANFASPIQFGDMKRPLSEEDALYTRFQVIF